MVPHATITLKILQPSRINLKLSVYAQLHEAFNFNATPLALPGTKIIAHEKPIVRGSSACRGIIGCYISAAINHYRYHDVYINTTGSIRINGIIVVITHRFKMSFRSSAEKSTIVAAESAHVLNKPTPIAPFSHIGDKKMEAFIN